MLSASLLLLGALVASQTPPAGPPPPCHADEARRSARSAELQEIVAADQADREIDWTPEVVARVMREDRERRMRVAEIFAEGCFTMAEDFAAAALVFQHGETIDHYLQAFVWAKRAVELGDEESRWLTTAALDRYLVARGHRQLFATQSHRGGDSECWCLQPIEESFPDRLRIEWVGGTLDEIVTRTRERFGEHACRPLVCDHELAATTPAEALGFSW